LSKTEIKPREEWKRPTTVSTALEIAKYWKNRYDKLKSGYDKMAQELVAYEGMYPDIENVLSGMIRKRNVGDAKLGLSELMSDYALFHRIDDIVKLSKPRGWVRITWEFTALALGLLFIWQLTTNIGFRAWLGQYMLGVIIAVAVVAYIAFQVRRQRK